MRDGAAPDGWRMARLGEVARIEIGRTPARNRPEFWDRRKSTNNRWVSIADMRGRFISDTSEYISDLAARLTRSKLVPPGTPLLSFKLTVGRVAIPTAPVYTNEAIAAVHSTGEADPLFLAYVLPTAVTSSLGDQAVKGVTLNTRKLRRLPILLPPLPEQRKIADILSSVDDAIEKTEAVIEQVRRVKHGLAQQLLTRGLPGRHTHYKQTEVGEIPACWEVVRLGEIIHRCQYGLSVPLISEPVGVPVLRMNNLADGGIDTTDLKYAALSENDRKVYALRPGDLLFNRTNSKDLVGKVSLFDLNSEVAFASYLLRLQVIEERALPPWLNHYLNLPGVQAAFRRLATPGVSQSNVNARALLKTPIPLPPIDEQRAIVESIDSFQSRMDGERESLAALRGIKSALMHVLLTGQVRVKAASGAAGG